MSHHESSSLDNCIKTCLECYQICLSTAMNHCLEMGGKHVEPSHFRLMINCAQICKTAAEFMLSSSSLHAKVCAVCSEICKACADDCKKVGDMEACVAVCERCSEECQAMRIGTN